jgi:protein-disulfide isomerase
MHRLKLIAISFAAFILLASSASAQTPVCDRLSADEKKIAQKILASEYPYDCCDDTIAKCLKQKPICSLVYRLAENICRRVAAGQDEQRIRRALSRRARTVMQGGRKVSIKLNGLPAVGEAGAPITLVEYACARCPYCSRITPDLYRAVTEGRLKGKVKLYFKLFPIRGHKYGKEGGLAFMAAAKLGRFWDYLLYSYERFDQYCPALQAQWAGKVGMDEAEFERIVNDPATREALIKSKKEGIVNKVDATPTFYINGKKYQGEVRTKEVIDFLEEEYERIKGMTYRK